MGNIIPLGAAIKKEMGEGTVVKNTCGMPFTITVTADGKSKKECMPMYYCVPCCMSSLCCKGAIDKTAKNATEVAGGAPQATEMER